MPLLEGIKHLGLVLQEINPQFSRCIIYERDKVEGVTNRRDLRSSSHVRVHQLQFLQFWSRPDLVEAHFLLFAKDAVFTECQVDLAQARKTPSRSHYLHPLLAHVAKSPMPSRAVGGR